MLSDEQIAEIEARLESATPGEWCTPPTFSGVTTQKHGDVCLSAGNFCAGNMLFIACAHQDIPALLADRAELQAEVDRLKSIENWNECERER